MTIAYPLQWPEGRERTSAYRRGRANFDTTFAVARDNLVAEVRRLGGRNLVISTNVPLRQDGLPYAKYRALDDEGVAVYFVYNGQQMSFACDRWNRVEHNMHAIVKTIDALRGIARWGTGDMLRAAFKGFSALPPPNRTKTWCEVFGLSTSCRDFAAVKAVYRRMVGDAHPDRGGTHEAMSQLNAALAAAERELKGEGS